MAEERAVLTGRVMVELAAPLDREWRGANELLWTTARGNHVVLNKTVTALACADYIADECGKRESALRTMARREVVHQLEKMHKDLPSVIVDGLSSVAFSAYQTWRKQSFKGERVLPTFRSDQPIPWRDGSNAWRLERDGRGYVLRLSLERSGETRWTMVPFALSVRGGGAFGHLRRMFEGGDGIKLGNAIVLRRKKRCEDGVKRERWFAQLTYSWPRPERAAGKHAVALHRGIRSFLTSACTDGDVRTLADGRDIQHTKACFAARRASLMRHVREAGKGARGHGRARRLLSVTKLNGVEDRWVKTRCQQVAAAAVQYAKRRGASTLLLEAESPGDAGKRKGGCDTPVERLIATFPFYRLHESIKWAAAKAGLSVVEAPTAYITQRCPACGATSNAHVDLAHHQYVCLGCDLKRSLDTVAALNMLSAAGYESHVRAALKRGAELARTMRAATKERSNGKDECKRDDAGEVDCNSEGTQGKRRPRRGRPDGVPGRGGAQRSNVARS